jgi:PKHD-type hydroxylase
MFLEVPDILTAEEVARLKALSETFKFVDGKISNPYSKVKNNLQHDYSDPGFQQVSQLCLQALMRHPDVRNFAFPKKMAPPTMTKYAVGMHYGLHSDSAFLPLPPRPLRSDLSCTIFLHEPASYDGGELSVQLGTRLVDFKMNPGGGVIYPSTTIHQVKPVTRGERLTVITFIESRIIDPVQRELLYQLNEVKELESLKMTDENALRMHHVTSALERMWTDVG